MRRATRFQLLALLLCGVLFSAKPDRVRGQEVESFRFQLGGAQVQTEGGEGIVIRLGEPSGYWIGIELEALDAEHRAGTDLPEGQGLEVQQVVPDGPAASAGVQEDDILVSVGDHLLHNLDDLQKLIQESEGKPLSVVLLRDGERKTIEVTPARRSQGGIFVLTAEGEEGEEGAEGPPQVRRLNPQGQPRAAGGAVQWQPLHVSGNAEFPEDLNVTIRKRGNEPLRIKVTQGVQSWTIGPDELDKLPEAIRSHVAGLLPHPAPAATAFSNRGQARIMIGERPQPGSGLAPGASLRPGAPAPGGSAQTTPPQAELQTQLQQLRLQLRALQEQVEALREKE